ncbi:hypothetical protein TNCV_4345041 [Trichonephila clavipes]|nr:hypothetical protein TNCV_4345041 [Trichonephila clavipes]
MRPKKHPYRNSRSKSQRLRRAKEIIKNLLSKTQNAETQLLDCVSVYPETLREMKVIEKLMDFENSCSFPQNETATRPGCNKDISHPKYTVGNKFGE